MLELYSALLALGVVGVILLAAELSYRRGHLQGENGRKIIHILVASFIASWPFFMETSQIVLLSVLMLGGVVVSRNLRIFTAIHDVKRRTWGDIIFPASIALLAVASNYPWVFAAAVLHLAVADGMAALVGLKFSKKFYKVFGLKKSIIGTSAFIVTSYAILILASHSSNGQPDISLALIIWLPLILALIENTSPYGTDNITVPLAVVAALTLL